ncbi:MAG: hypothetical protein IJW29_06155 [Clostridia bacterium]|nr:hypothetical protein [Clostridia bacterium]
MAKNEAKITFNAQTKDFNDAINKANSTMTELRSELKLVDAQMANTGTTVDGLEQKENILRQQQEQLAAKTEALTAKYEAAVRIWGEGSIEAQKMATQVNNARVAEEKLKSDVSKCNAELQEAKTKMDNAERSARDLADGFDKAAREAKDLDTNIGDIAAGNMIADFAGNAISSLAGLEESTRQYRNEQNKLEAIAQSSGKSVEDLKGQYSDLFAITADETLASTAAANMDAIGLNTEQNNALLHAATGVWARYGDSIPLDALMESINETSKVSTLTGNLTDAIVWAGISEDEFNEKLAACSTEQERQQLIIDTLNGKYGTLADSYIENNQAVIDVNRANEKMLDNQSKLAEQIAPLQAGFTSLAADGIGFLADHLNIIAPIAIAAGVAFGILAVALNFGSIVQFLSGAMGVLNAVMALNPAVLVVAGLVLLGTAFATLWTQCEGFREFWIGLWDTVTSAASTAWDTVSTTITTKIDDAKEAVGKAIDKIKGFFDFEFKWPHIPLPHFSVSPPGWQIGDLLKGSIPSLDIQWYAKGGIMTKPTLFGGGEAGPEAVLPIERLQGFVDKAVQKAMGTDGTTKIVDAINANGGKAGDQTIIFNQPVKSAAETARAIRMERTYGLAGDRR